MKKFFLNCIILSSAPLLSVELSKNVEAEKEELLKIYQPTKYVCGATHTRERETYKETDPERYKYEFDKTYDPNQQLACVLAGYKVIALLDGSEKEKIDKRFFPVEKFGLGMFEHSQKFFLTEAEGPILDDQLYIYSQEGKEAARLFLEAFKSLNVEETTARPSVYLYGILLDYYEDDIDAYYESFPASWGEYAPSLEKEKKEAFAWLEEHGPEYLKQWKARRGKK